MNVPEIDEVKNVMENLKKKEVILNWELPYENLLTRLSAAIFFIEPPHSENGKDSLEEISTCFEGYENFSFRINSERKLSELKYRVTFSQEEKDKNQQVETLN